MNADKEEKVGTDVLSDEKNKRGRVKWSDFVRFFSYYCGGMCGIFIIVVLHLCIHATSVFVSIYLGLTLTEHFGEVGEETDEEKFIRILIILISTAIVSNSIGKLISNRIFMSISRNMHKKMV